MTRVRKPSGRQQRNKYQTRKLKNKRREDEIYLMFLFFRFTLQMQLVFLFTCLKRHLIYKTPRRMRVLHPSEKSSSQVGSIFYRKTNWEEGLR